MDITWILIVCSLKIVLANYSREALVEKYPGFGTDWIPLSQNEDGEFTIGYFQEPTSEARFSLSPEPAEVVTFTLFTRENYKGIRIKSAKNLKNFDRSKPTKFVTHGWMSSGTADTCVTIKDNWLKKYDANVFIMDWEKISGNLFYPIPMRATTKVGDFYAEFLKGLVAFGVHPKNMHLVGHSLGAHITGFAARQIKGKVARITGLDPALPGFNIPIVEGGHLNSSDADFVDVIHTCAGFLGMKNSLGHADFYPNGGGPPQPGCGNIIEMVEACSHGRSWHFFAKSITSSVPFLAYPCDSFQDFLQNRECTEDGVPMGDPTPIDARGEYFLKTDGESPFLDISQNSIL